MPAVTCHLRYELEPSQLEAFERFAIREESGCVVRHERTFLRPVLDGDLHA